MTTSALALRGAAYGGDLAEVRRLLLEGVDPNVADEWGRTALSLAAGEGHISVVSALLGGGAWADPHDDYDTHDTPLKEAAPKGHLEVVKLLVESGANPNFHNGVAQRTAEDHARSEGHAEVVKHLANLRQR